MNKKDRKRIRYILNVDHAATLISVLEHELDRYDLEWLPKELRDDFSDFRNNLHDYKSSIYKWFAENASDLYEDQD